MFIYNVTTKVDPSIHESWVEWMKNTHIPQIMDTGCFEQFQFVRLLEIDDSDGPTYAVQYKADSKANYNLYLEKHAGALRKHAFDTWGSKIISFRSLMQVVH
ncbi:MAG: DUF4286 family protein [Chitinophagaceae bacterium]|nr:DUF4286 family protein [Chitinophagaceae bacterium]